MMKRTFAVAAIAAIAAQAAHAETTSITWWHGMGGANEQVINQIAEKFNAAQQVCAITPVSKGTYEEALASGIAAFSSGEHPNVIQIFDAGAATIMNAPGATIPAEDLLAQNGHAFDREPLFPVYAGFMPMLTASSSGCRSTHRRRSCMSMTRHMQRRASASPRPGPNSKTWPPS